MKDKLRTGRMIKKFSIMMLILTMIPASAFATEQVTDNTDADTCRVTIEDFEKLDHAYYIPDGGNGAEKVEITTEEFQVEKETAIQLYLAPEEKNIIREIKVDSSRMKLNRVAGTNEVMAEFTPEDYCVIKYTAGKEVNKIESKVKNADFGTVLPGYTERKEKAITVKNTGDNPMVIRKPVLKGFDLGFTVNGEVVKEERAVLEPGKKIAVTIKPETGLPEGKYGGKLKIEGFRMNDEEPSSAVKEKNAKADAAVSVNVAFVVKDGKFEIKLDKKTEDFGRLVEDYTWSEYRTFTVTNTGNMPITLKQPVSENYYVDDLTATKINPGEKSVFTLQPVKGIENGEHEETVTVYGTYEGKTVAETSVKVLIAVGDEEETVAEEDKDNAPATGDSNNLAMLILLTGGCLLSAAGLKRKMNEK